MPETPPCDACGEASCPSLRRADVDGTPAYLCHHHWNERPGTEVDVMVRSRRAAAKAGPEMYGTMPPVGELPTTVPAGTQLAITSSGKYVAVDPLTLFRRETGTMRYGLRGERYSLDGVEKHCGPFGFMPERIDWTTVPKQPAAQRVANETPAPAPRAAEDSGCSDPYRRTDGLTDAQIAALMLVSEQAARTAPPQPAPDRRDPADWDCWATPTWETD